MYFPTQETHLSKPFKNRYEGACCAAWLINVVLVLDRDGATFHKLSKFSQKNSARTLVAIPHTA